MNYFQLNFFFDTYFFLFSHLSVSPKHLHRTKMCVWTWFKRRRAIQALEKLKKMAEAKIADLNAKMDAIARDMDADKQQAADLFVRGQKSQARSIWKRQETRQAAYDEEEKKLKTWQVRLQISDAIPDAEVLNRHETELIQAIDEYGIQHQLVDTNTRHARLAVAQADTQALHQTMHESLASDVARVLNDSDDGHDANGNEDGSNSSSDATIAVDMDISRFVHERLRTVNHEKGKGTTTLPMDILREPKKAAIDTSNSIIHTLPAPKDAKLHFFVRDVIQQETRAPVQTRVKPTTTLSSSSSRFITTKKKKPLAHVHVDKL